MRMVWCHLFGRPALDFAISQTHIPNTGRRNIAIRASVNVTKTTAVKIQEVLKKYGWVAAGTYLSTYCATFGSLFIGLKNGWITPTLIVGDEGSVNDLIVGYLDMFAFTEQYVDTIRGNPFLASGAVAWLGTKLTEPLRWVLTFWATPKVAVWMRGESERAKLRGSDDGK